VIIVDMWISKLPWGGWICLAALAVVMAMSATKEPTQAAVRKSIHRPEYPAVVGCLVAVRRAANLTQVELAARLRHSQGWVSAVERGDSRLDLLQVHDWCRVCGGPTMEGLGRMLDQALALAAQRPPGVGKAGSRKVGRGRGKKRRSTQAP